MAQNSGSILVVDDEALSRMVLATRLQEDGYQVTEAVGGDEALALVRSQSFDVILLDMLMPDLDGYQVLEALKRDSTVSHIPVIIVSGFDDMESIVKCIEGGAADYVLKPFNPALLRARIRACLADKWLRDLEQAYVREIQVERQRAEDLLLNILPASIARRLQQAPGVIADSFEQVTVLFADIVEFTQRSATQTPSEVVALLNAVFSRFDDLADRYGLEKIKTIGDAYMVVGGVPTARPDHVEAVAEMALAMQTAIQQLNAEQGLTPAIQLRMGIHSGPVTAGVIGRKKFVYDLWGDTVNVASRLESHGVNGQIQVSGAVYNQLRSAYHLTPNGAINLKGRGTLEVYLLVGKQ